jgi:hypothetical protein
MTHAIGHCDRPWWKRPPTWFIAIVALLLLIFAVVEIDGRAPAMPYGTFLDQLGAGNVASVTFQGTEISGRFKHPVGETKSGGAAQRDAFHSRIPDFGDPALIPELRKQRVVIDVATPSPWAWLLGRVPWPMLVILVVVLLAGVVRMVRGGRVGPGSTAPGMPAHPMISLLSGLFAKQRGAGPEPERDSEGPKGH